jgi:pyruvate dehydrogenase E2 component (dihydrolipoamide acetyltransferase)
MATAIVMPKQGQSVESCLIANWKKKVGDPVAAGEVLGEVETDKALVEVESPVAGTVLALFFAEGADVPVLTNIAAIGEVGENIEALRPAARPAGAPEASPAQPAPAEAANQTAVKVSQAEATTTAPISPRALKLARQHGLELAGVPGSGPGGRIIERDVQARLSSPLRLTPLAKSMLTQGGFQAPNRGSGVSGRIIAEDLLATQPQPPGPAEAPPVEIEVEIIPLKGVRKIIAQRMLESLQTTAQLTLNSSAEARALLAYRQRLKASSDGLGLQQITINDLILFAVARVLPHHPDLNALFEAETITRYKEVHLGLAVATPRGLLVPVIKNAHRLSLKQLAQASRSLANASQSGKISPDELKGGTFTVTNLGSFGVESFTPVLNPPQVAILGVGNINLKPVQMENEVEFIPHLGLSLTINHQVVDGAPAARFLQALAGAVAEIELILAI